VRFDVGFVGLYHGQQPLDDLRMLVRHIIHFGDVSSQVIQLRFLQHDLFTRDEAGSQQYGANYQILS